MARQSTDSAFPDGTEDVRTTPHTHWLICTLQISQWLLLQPSAWHSFLDQLVIDQLGDGCLRGNFCWAEVSPQQRRRPRLRRLLVLEYSVLPVVVGAVVGLALTLLGQHASDIVFGVCVGWAASLGTAIAGSWVISVAASWIASLVGGLLGGLIFGLMGADSLVLFRSGLGVGTSDLSRLIEALLPPILLASFPNGVAAGVALSVAHSQNKSNSKRNSKNDSKSKRSPLNRSQHWGQQLGGIALGVIGSVLVLSLGGGLANAVVNHQQANGIGMGASGAEKMVAGLLLSGLLGLMVARHTRRWRREMVWSVVLGLGLTYVASFAFSTDAIAVRGFAIGGGNALLLTVLFALAYNLGAAIAGVPAGALAGVLGSSSLHTLFVSVTTESSLLPPLLLSLLFTTLGITLPRWLPIVLYPFELLWQLLLCQQERASFRWHPAFWDEQQRLPLWGLDQYLVSLSLRSPLAGQAAFDYLSQGSQRWAVQNAQIELDAQQLEDCVDVDAIATIHRQITMANINGAPQSPTTQLMLNFRRLSKDIQAALNQSSPYAQRLMFNASDRHITGLIQDLARSHHPNAARFRPIFQHWQHIISQYQQHLAHQADLSQTIESPYIVGIPLSQQQAVFVGRQDLSAKLERLLRERRHSSFLLYGQRRMGKTSLLNNLGRLLPSHIVPLFIDLQGPTSKSPDHEGFLYNLARGIVRSAQQSRQIALPSLTRDRLSGDPFTAFDEWLDDVEDCFQGKTALLALDEFEALDQAFARGHFDEDAILSLLRNIIQHRPKFKVLLSGSHTLEAFQRWASYLINVQALHISYLQPSEAQRLIERPVHDFPLHYEPAATQHILALTRGHPFLVQLLCAEIIARRNEQQTERQKDSQNEQLCTRDRQVTVAEVEAAVTPALASGSFFFADIEHQQCESLNLLKKIASQGEKGPYTPATNQEIPLLEKLVKQELLEVRAQQYQFQVALIRRWFAQVTTP